MLPRPDVLDHNYYFDQHFPFQDRVLRICTKPDTELYLTGGIALSRGYLNHHFSDDLDFFVNDEHRFGLWAERIIQGFTQSAE